MMKSKGREEIEEAKKKAAKAEMDKKKAEKELQEKRLPFIIMRPLPNGKCEYWNVNDLEYL